MGDPEKLAETRAKALANKNKYQGVGSGDSFRPASGDSFRPAAQSSQPEFRPATRAPQVDSDDDEPGFSQQCVPHSAPPALLSPASTEPLPAFVFRFQPPRAEQAMRPTPSPPAQPRPFRRSPPLRCSPASPPPSLFPPCPEASPRFRSHSLCWRPSGCPWWRPRPLLCCRPRYLCLIWAPPRRRHGCSRPRLLLCPGRSRPWTHSLGWGGRLPPRLTRLLCAGLSPRSKRWARLRLGRLPPTRLHCWPPCPCSPRTRRLPC